MLSSHGRGGAGNMADSEHTAKTRASDLKTPTLKTPVVTTGRGGTGNMAKNNDPYETRLRQDVEAPPRRASSGAQHAGRGGAGNVFKDDPVAREMLTRKHSHEHAVDDSHAAPESFAAKGRNWLFGKKA